MRKIIDRFLFAVSLVVFVLASVCLIRIFLEYKKGADTYGKLAHDAIISPHGDEVMDKLKEYDSSMTEDSTEYYAYKDVEINFKYLKSLNQDIVGWIRFDGGRIDYPILQGEDNEEYLYTMADKKENKSGSIFLEALSNPDFEDPHTIIYGHNMKDLSMFGSLKMYKTKDAYYSENMYFKIYTPEKTFRYQIFAYYDVLETDQVYRVGFGQDKSFLELINTMKQRSYRKTGIDADKGDKVITLSTCSGMNDRFVVHAKRIR